MRVTVVSDRCQGHGTCYGHHPDLFEPDVEGFGRTLVPEATDDGVVAELVRAADACPEHAIIVAP